MTKRVSELSAFSKANRAAKRRQSEIEDNRGMRGVAKAVGKCGAKKRDGGKCGMAKGHGTTHPGIGRCKHHGGNLPNHKKNAAKIQAQFMGAPKDINPLEAIIWCIKITAGEVEWLSQQIAEIDKKDDWYEHTVIGKQMNVLVRERAAAQDRLVKYSKDAISLGIAERAVRLVEQYGYTLARLLEGVLGELQLTAAQKKLAPHVVRKHLVLLESARGDVIEGTAVAAIPQRVAS